MNRYTIAGIAKDAGEGKSIVVVETHAATYLPEFERAYGSKITCRANGRELVAFHGDGVVHLVDPAKGGNLRGFKADVVYLGEGAGAPELIDQALMCVTAKRGEVVRA